MLAQMCLAPDCLLGSKVITETVNFILFLTAVHKKIGILGDT